MQSQVSRDSIEPSRVVDYSIRLWDATTGPGPGLGTPDTSRSGLITRAQQRAKGGQLRGSQYRRGSLARQPMLVALTDRPQLRGPVTSHRIAPPALLMSGA
jgi:hypothetical protein